MLNAQRRAEKSRTLDVLFAMSTVIDVAPDAVLAEWNP
jgi:hypothetical protein